MAPSKKKPKTEKTGVKKMGPIYPVFGEEKVKRRGKITKRLVVKKKLIWVQWESTKKARMTEKFIFSSTVKLRLTLRLHAGMSTRK